MTVAPAQRPLCPNCGVEMALARVIPGDRGLAPLNVFECARCGVYLSEAGGETRAVADDGHGRA